LNESPPEKHPYRTLAISLTFGVGIFVGGLYGLLMMMALAGIRLDSSIVNFYWIIAGCGALFGFERWLYHEQGGVNPFHDN
jgi:hypothetical protein